MKLIGFATQFYTLWDLQVTECFETVNNRSFKTGDKYDYTYFQNLSKSEEEAKKKFTELTGIANPRIDTELRGKTSSFSSTVKCNLPSDIFPKGKYYGKLIGECEDLEYLLWAFDNMFTDEESRTIAKKALIKGGYVSMDGYIYSKEKYVELMERAKKEDYINSLEKGFVFSEGEKIEKKAFLISKFFYNGKFGMQYTFIMEIEGKLVKYSGGTDLDLEEGERFTIKGTIKHNSYYSERHGLQIQETKILRTKIIK